MDGTDPGRRRHSRVEVGAKAGFRIEFPSPYDESKKLDLQVQDLSPAGISFALDGELPGLEVGSTIRRATLRLGESRVQGEFLVCHVTARRGLPPLCGTLFYPRTDRDLASLKAAVAALDAG